MNGRLYIHELVEPSHAVEIQAYDLMTRTADWAWQSPAQLWQSSGDTSLCGGNGHLYLTTTKGLFALSEATGRLIWHASPEQDFSQREPIFIEPQ